MSEHVVFLPFCSFDFFYSAFFSGMATPFVQWGKIVTFGMAFDFHYR